MFSSTHLLAPPKFSGIGAAIVLLLLFPFSIIHAQSYTLKGRIIAEGAHGSRIDLSAGIIVAGYAPAAADPYLDSPVWKHATTPQSRNGNAFTAEDIPAGKYLIYAYVDHNGNRRLDRGEHLASYPHTVDLKGDVVRVELEFAPKIIYSRNNWKARDYLERNAKPKFRQGSRIPSLTATGYGRGNDVAIALGRHWRYAVEIGAGRGREEANGKPRPRNTSVKALVESIRTAPEQFKVSSTNYLVKQFTKNTDYYTAYPDAYITNSATGEVIRRTSPIASAGIFHAIGGKWAKDLNTIKRKFGDFHVDYLINGGESGLDVPAFGRSRWEQDDRIVADYESSPYKDNSSLGQQHWHKYVSVRKAQQEKWLITKLKQDLGRTQDVPPTYTFYNASHVPNTGRYGGNNQYCFDYREWRKRDVVDYSAPEYYYKHFNSGWTGMHKHQITTPYDLITHVMNVYTWEAQHPQKIKKPFVSCGWRDNREGKGFNNVSNPDRWMGFMKLLGLTGAVSPVISNFDDPFATRDYREKEAKKSKPYDYHHWVWQYVVSSHAHAAFTHLENYVYNGTLVARNQDHPYNRDPYYRGSRRWYAFFPKGEYVNDRTREGGIKAVVVANKLKNKDKYLILAWANTGNDRKVTVGIPGLGEQEFFARKAGTLYEPTLKNGKIIRKTVLDGPAMSPSVGMTAPKPLYADELTTSTEPGQETLPAAALRVYPVPAKDQLSVFADTPLNGADYRLVNTLGVEVRSGQLTAGQNEVDLTGLPSGHYLLQALSKLTKQFAVRRVVVQQ